MADLRTLYLGFELRSPLVASAGPLTGRLDTLLRLEDAGVAAVVLPSLFEEELVSESLQLNDLFEHGTEQFGEALSYLPDPGIYDLGPERHAKLVESAKERLNIPVIASVNAPTPEGCARYASLLAEAGADAVELNLYAVPANPDIGAEAVENGYLEAIRHVRAAVTVPVAAKLSPFFSSTGHFARQAVEAGADGLVLFNRFYQPDLDLESLDVLPIVELSHPFELRLPLRWIAILRPRLPDVSLAASSGVHDGASAVKALLVGADVTMMTSALLRHGPEHVRKVETALDAWLDAHEYESVNQLRGSFSQSAAPDPSTFERANYLRVLSSFHLPSNDPEEEATMHDPVRAAGPGHSGREGAAR
ncbi:MAG: dihydroorotate dehydrogenase-like protein [Acidimicrobiales bacterium]|jgi:dihydroorotate dehydrogenase (fumarate)